jgi:hypothetical protein
MSVQRALLDEPRPLVPVRGGAPVVASASWAIAYVQRLAITDVTAIVLDIVRSATLRLPFLYVLLAFAWAATVATSHERTHLKSIGNWLAARWRRGGEPIRMKPIRGLPGCSSSSTDAWEESK